MARRRKKDTEKTLELVIWLVIGIPVAIVAVLKWIISCVSKLRQSSFADLKSIDLQKIDQMDGLSFEYYVAELLKKNGYKRVFVTSGSGDFGVDITAYKDNDKYAFQCKNYKNKLGVSPIQEVYSGAPKYNASVCVVVTNSYFTPHAIELAESLGVILWDRTELSKLIRLAESNSNTVLTTGRSGVDNEQGGNNFAEDTPILSIPITGGFAPATLILTQQNLIYQTKKDRQIYPVETIIDVSRFVARLIIEIGNRNQALDLAVGNINNAKAMEQELRKQINSQ